MPKLAKPSACAGCSLETRGTGYVPGEGPAGSPIAFVAESAGVVEALTGRPLVGDAGGMFTRLLNLLGWTRDAFRIDNCARCFPAETLVCAPGLRRVFKRRYTGVMVTVTTGQGDLTGTPNHPVLTTRGWQPLGELQEGDHLIRPSVSQGESRRDPHIEDVPPSIAQVFQAVTKSEVRRRMVGSHMDFHGDGRDGEVEVVRADGMLGAHDQASVLQLLLEQTLEPADWPRPTTGAREQASSTFLRRTAMPPHRLVGRSGETQSTLSAFSTHPQFVHVGLRSPRDPEVRERTPHLAVAEMQAPLDLLGAFTAEVELCKITRVSLAEFSGHVYNLETSSHKYLAGGFIVHNCQPPGDWFDERAPWYYSALAHCQYVERETLSQGSKVVVALGGTALRRLMHFEHHKDIRIQDFHGSILRDPTDRYWVVPTYHPSFLQRGATNLIGTVLWDLRQAEIARDSGKPADAGTLIIDPPLDWFTAWVDQVVAARQQDPAAYPVTSDVETPDKAGGKSEGELTTEDQSFQILRQNVACHPDEGITVPEADGYRQQLARLYASPGDIWQWNREYDFIRQVRGSYFTEADSPKVVDLMWYAKVLQSDVPLGLGFWAPFYSTWGPWKHLARTEPAKYGAIDALQNHRIGFGLIADLIQMGQYRIARRHTHDLKTKVLRPAQLVGVKIDRQRLLIFKESLAEKARTSLAAIQLVVPASICPLTPKEGLVHKPLDNVLHVKASAFTRKGAPRKGRQPTEIKQELYARARLLERLVLKDVWTCQTCGAVDVARRHRCQNPQGARPSPSGDDRDGRGEPQLVLAVASVTRWFWQEPFNPDSWQQVLAYIKAKKHRPGRSKKSKSQTESTDRETLLRLSRTTDDAFYRHLLDYRAVVKVKGTYVEGTERRLDAEDRLHPVPTFRPTTMRLSYVDPNITNVVADKGGEEGLAAGFRRCVVATVGTRILEVDFCVAPETRILKADLTWVCADTLVPGDELIGFDERVGKGNGKNSKFRASSVIATRTITRQRVRVQTTHGTIVVAADHPFIGRWNHGDDEKARRSNRTWIKAKDLRIGTYLSFMVAPWEVEHSEEGGYLQGFFDGEGWVSNVVVGYGQNLGPTYLRVQDLLQHRRFAFRVADNSSTAQVEIASGLQGTLTFLGTIRPPRLLPKARGVWEGRQTWGKKSTVVRVTGLELLEDGPVVAIETSTKTYISEGFFSHNSAIEAVETGWCARDPHLMRVARLGIHSYLIAHRMKDPPDLHGADGDIAKHLKTIKQRAGALLYDQIKHTVYGVLYGQTPIGLQYTWPHLYPTQKAAEEMVDFLFGHFPSVKIFQQVVLDTAARQHYLGGAEPYTFTPPAPGVMGNVKGHPFQYRHWFWSIYAYKRLTRTQELRLLAKYQKAGLPAPITYINGQPFRLSRGADANRAIALYPQGIAAGDLKEVELRLFADPDSPSYIGDAYFGRTPLRAPIHDSLLLEVPFRQWDRVAEKVSLEMTRPIIEQPLPLEWGPGPYLQIGVAAKAGPNWADTEDLVGSWQIDDAVHPVEADDTEDFEDLGRAVS